ncbi:MAG: YfiR family protein [Methylococcaceae bacterium]|nr:YfiR family protein [Methylococcaceae bacterium]
MQLINKILLLSCLMCGLPTHAVVADEDNAEYKIKAGYLYNFIKFVTWPTDNAKTFNICIFGQDPFGELLDPIEKRTAFGLSIKLFRFDTESRTQTCHIVFVSANNKAVWGTNDQLVIRDIGKVLSVGEGEAFVEQGGMIGFVKREGKVKLQVNLKMLQESDLTVSAKLLEVAEIIKGRDSD